MVNKIINYIIMYNITVINDSTLGNHPKKFEVKDWNDLCEKLFEKLRDEQCNPISENDKNNIRNNVRFEIKDNMTVNLSDVIDLSTGNFYKSAATPIKASLGTFTAVAASTISSILPTAAVAGLGINPRQRAGRYYQWDKN